MPKSLLLGLLFAAAALVSGQDREHRGSQRGDERLIKEVRHELTMLPYYSVFDAENAVKKIEGVERVINNIEVLPPSPNDDSIRRAVYRAIYSQPGLDTYSLRAVPTIHIIVKNGHVTLTGAVANQGDKERAGIAANGVPGVFSVTNNIQTDR
jgi:hyperosmotically inducible protein